MRIEVNPKSLQNLEQICEVLYKLHPSVLDYFIDTEERLGKILGLNEKRELMINNINTFVEIEKDKVDDEVDDEDDEKENNFKEMINIIHGDGDYPFKNFVFNRLLRYLQLDTYEYIPIKIFVEVEDQVKGKKVRELVRLLEKTNTPEHFYLNKRELDYAAYFAEGYGLTMNEEQEKKLDDLLSRRDPEELKKLLIKEKLYYY